jgi:hypothetical protein
MRRAAGFGAFIALAVAVGVPAPASAGKGGTERPFHVTGVVRAPLTDCVVNVVGPAKGTHIGNGTNTFSINLCTGAPPPGIITAANGDQIFDVSAGDTGDPSGVVCPPDAFDRYDGTVIITGGTGRFTGATGSFRSSGCVGGEFDPATGVFTLIITFDNVGTISY